MLFNKNYKETLEDLKIKIKKKILSEGLMWIIKDGYPVEFLEEDVNYFIKQRKRPNLEDFIIGLTILRWYFYSKKGLKTRKKIKKIKKEEYMRRIYLYSVAYMYYVLKGKGYSPDERKRLIVYFFNFIRPDIISNTGIFLCLRKIRKSPYLRKKTVNELASAIPKMWILHILAFLSLCQDKQQKGR